MAHVFHADGCSMGRMASVGPHLRPHRVASNINTANCHPQPAAMADPGDAEYERALEALSGLISGKQRKDSGMWAHAFEMMASYLEVGCEPCGPRAQGLPAALGNCLMHVHQPYMSSGIAGSQQACLRPSTAAAAAARCLPPTASPSLLPPSPLPPAPGPGRRAAQAEHHPCGGHQGQGLHVRHGGAHAAPGGLPHRPLHLPPLGGRARAHPNQRVGASRLCDSA